MADFFGSTARDPSLFTAQVKDVQNLAGRLNSISGFAEEDLAEDDRIIIGQVPSNAVLNSLGQVFFDAFGALVTLDLGLEKTVGGVTTTEAAALVSAEDVSSAGTVNAMKAVVIENKSLPVWDHMTGFTEDPGGMINVVATLAGANPAAVTLAWEILFAER
ncbi:MAG: hypothetical protein V3W41_22440 [Planctomycetota bacterium]